MLKTPQVGKPERRGAGWFVPSGQVGYYVEWLHASARWRCTCSRFRFRPHLACKHRRGEGHASGGEDAGCVRKGQTGAVTPAGWRIHVPPRSDGETIPI